MWSRLHLSLKSIPLPTGTAGGRLARAVSWNIVGGAASRSASLIGSFFVARTLGETGFGQLGMLLTTFTMLGVFASFGLGTTATRFISLCRLQEPERAGRIATFAPAAAGLISLLAVVLVFWSAPWFAKVALNDATLTPMVRWAAPLLLLAALQDATQGILAGLESFRTLARATAVAGCSVAAGMVSGALVGNLRGCLIGMLVGMTAGYLFTAVSTRVELREKGIPLNPDGWMRELPNLWQFAVPAVLAASVVGPVNWLAMALLAHQPGGYPQLGIFSAANQWRNAILYVPTLAAAAGLPILTHLWKNTSQTEYLRLIRLKMLLGFVTSMAVAVPVAVAAPLIMAGYGSGFSEGALVLVVLAGAAVVLATLTMIGQALISEGRMWTGLLLNSLWAIVLLATAFRWIPTQGALGLAWANLAAFGVHLISVSLFFIVVMCRRSAPAGP